MKERTPRRLAWSAFLLWALLAVASIVFDLATKSGPGQPGGNVGDVLFSLSTAAFPVVAILILSRQPTNRIGWILMAIGVGWVIGPESYGEFALSRGLPGGALAIALSSPTWAPPIGLMGTVLLLRFPDGRLLSPRWRKVEVLGLAAISIVFVAILISPGNLEDVGYPNLENPLGVEPLGPVLEALLPVLLLIPVTIVASAASLVVRFRRSAGTERLQLKWLTTAAATMAAIYLLAMLVSVPYAWGGSDTPSGVSIIQNMAVTSFMLIPISIGFAVLKYRLYDIDVVINKAVVYGALAAFITAVYVGVVVGLGSLIGTRGEPNLVLSIAATAFVAAAFQPVRERVQHVANRLVYGKRATPYEVLSTFADRLSTTYSLDDVLPRLARLVAEGTGAVRVGIWVRVGTELRSGAAWPPDGNRWPASLSDEQASVPGASRTMQVRQGDDVLGLLAVEMPASEPLTPAHEKLLQDVSAQASLLLRNVALVEELRASRVRLVAAQDEERRRIERNIHDGAQQQLVALAVRLKLAEAVARKKAPEVAEMLEGIREDSTQALENLRDLARGIYPPLLADQGLAAALTAQARKVSFPVEVEPNGISRYPQETEAAVYFCVLEALQNAAKYAEASRAVVRLRAEDGQVLFEIDDDGKGFDVAGTTLGAGLTNMRDRVEALGGTVTIESEPGRGTTVAGRIPLRERDESG